MNALEAINLSKTYSDTDGFFLKNKKNIRAVNDISFTLKENQTLGIVGAVSYTHLTLPTKA